MHFNIKKIISTILCGLIIMSVFTCISYAKADKYVWSTIDETSYEFDEEVTQQTSNDVTFNLGCESAVLIEQNTGEILYEKNSHEQLRPASVTKIMSILLIMEAIEQGKITYDAMVPCSENASSMGGSQIWLDTREMLSVNDMLKAICIVSANDCVVAMAEYIAGSEAGFVEMMNNKAKELGMNDTYFKNCHGIDEDGHVTSAYDISLMSRELLENYPEITKYTTAYMDSIRDGKSELVNTNKLIRNYSGATGLKTGSTSLALYNLSASATRDNLSLIAVVMKAPTTKVRFQDARTLLDYGFSKYSFASFGSKGDEVANVQISKGVKTHITAVLENDVNFITEKGQEAAITQTITLNDKISAPISQGDIIGEASYCIDNEIIEKVNLVASESVNKLSIFNEIVFVFTRWFNMCR